MHQLPKILVVARHAESVRNVAKAGQVFFPDPEARRGLEGEADHLAGLTDTGGRIDGNGGRLGSGSPPSVGIGKGLVGRSGGLFIRELPYLRRKDEG